MSYSFIDFKCIFFDGSCCSHLWQQFAVSRVAVCKFISANGDRQIENVFYLLSQNNKYKVYSISIWICICICICKCVCICIYLSARSSKNADGHKRVECENICSTYLQIAW